MTSPKQLGYRMPAEWEPHMATWLSWPHKEASWPGKLHLIQPVYAQMVAALAQSETVHINVNDEAMEQHARRLLKQAGATGDIRFHRFPTNDAWCRDHGAIFVRRVSSPPAPLPEGEGRKMPSPPAAWTECEGDTPSPSPCLPVSLSPHLSSPPPPLPCSHIAATDWGYNAWGNKYPPFDLDNLIPALMADALGVPRFDGGMVLEGGSIDVNGAGLLLTSEACLLNENRNPHLTRDQIERRLCDFLGVERILWLGDGIVGDDTDGHVDDITRFVAADTILTCVESDPDDDNYRPLQENIERLRSMRNLAGRSLDIVELPMPPAVVCEGQRLPASYANFYIANTAVLLPGYNHPRDAEAKRILAPLFPDREIVQIDCSDLIWGLGAFHCLTQQVPSAGESMGIGNWE